MLSERGCATEGHHPIASRNVDSIQFPEPKKVNPLISNTEDARPTMRRTGASSSDFPMEAMRWGFEGWVRVEFDILADGRTSAQRAVVAYPPLVFRDAAVGVLKDAQFEQSYRPEGAPGYGGLPPTID